MRAVAAAAQEPIDTSPGSPNPTLQLNAALGIVVIEFVNKTGAVTSSIPTQQKLEAYKIGTATPPGQHPYPAKLPEDTGAQQSGSPVPHAATVAPPATAISQPAPAVAQPITTGTQPVTAVTQPAATVTQPVTTVAPPATATAQPVTVVAQPVAVVAPPAATVAQTTATSATDETVSVHTV